MQGTGSRPCLESIFIVIAEFKTQALFRAVQCRLPHWKQLLCNPLQTSCLQTLNFLMCMCVCVYVYAYRRCTHLNPAMRKKLGMTTSGMTKWKRWSHLPLEHSAAANRSVSVVVVSSSISMLLRIRGNRSPGG